VAVVGVFVEAEIGGEDHGVADVVTQRGEGDLHDPVRIPGAAPVAVLPRRYAEEDDTGHAEGAQPAGLGDERGDGVLDDPRKRQDGLRLVDALAHEERSDHVGRTEPDLGDQVTQSGRPAQAAHPGSGERHGVGKDLPSGGSHRPPAPASRTGHDAPARTGPGNRPSTV
jgi:hypothetical protein